MSGFTQPNSSALVLDPRGGILRAVVGAGVHSEILHRGDGRQPALLTETAREAGYRLLREVFSTTYAGRKTKDGKDLGPALYELYERADLQGQAGVYPDDKLPAEVLERRKAWAARKAVRAAKAEELDALLGAK